MGKILKISGDNFAAAMLPGANWWACYMKDATKEMWDANQGNLVMAVDEYKGTYFYARIVCFVCNAYSEPDSDATNCVNAYIISGADIDRADNSVNFVKLVYSEKDLSQTSVFVP